MTIDFIPFIPKLGSKAIEADICMVNLTALNNRIPNSASSIHTADSRKKTTKELFKHSKRMAQKLINV